MSDNHLEALGRCREKIDELDRRLVDVLNERTSIVEEIGRIKRDAAMPIYEPNREVKVFENVAGHNKGPIPTESLQRIFERVIDEMRRIQKQEMEPEKKD
jgi:chorismate mutase-like protein